jgi:hypothetical protein
MSSSASSRVYKENSLALPDYVHSFRRMHTLEQHMSTSKQWNVVHELTNALWNAQISRISWNIRNQIQYSNIKPAYVPLFPSIQTSSEPHSAS